MQRWGLSAGVLVAVALAACAAPSGESPSSSAHRPGRETGVAPGEGFERFDRLVEPGRWRGTTADVVEVWVCRVPAASTAPTYAGLPLRLDLVPAQLTTALQPLVDYFDTLSNGAYRPMFVAGGTLELAGADGPSECVDAALGESTGRATVVLAVADAEHVAGRPGGQGSGGNPCTSAPPCPAVHSRRAAYVGAADFHPDWGGRPPLDLVAHELGHTLGLVHSAVDPAAGQPYQSGLDVMSNSAAARAALPDRRDAPGTLAVQRLIAGWLTPADVQTLPSTGGDVALVRADATEGPRVLVLPVDQTAFITVEVVVADSLQAHLARSGVAVHLVDTAGGEVVVSPTGFMAPGALLAVGEFVVAHGWRVTVANDWRIAVEPAGA